MPYFSLKPELCEGWSQSVPIRSGISHTSMYRCHF